MKAIILSLWIPFSAFSADKNVSFSSLRSCVQTSEMMSSGADEDESKINCLWKFQDRISYAQCLKVAVSARSAEGQEKMSDFCFKQISF